MSMIKHEIPILEYDNTQNAVIDPDHEHLALSLPQKCVFAFLGGYIDTYAQAHGGRVVSHFVSATKRYPIYVLTVGETELTLCQAPVGAAPAAQLLDWLIAYGVREIISAGSCGALEHFAEGAFLIPERALRDEGTSYHYAPPSRFIDVQATARQAIAQTLTAHDLPYQSVTTWSTDGFYRETKEKVAYRKSEGCAVVEMECAALAACAAFRGVTWGMLLYTADSLANLEHYDERDWGGNAYEAAMELCVEAVCRISADAFA